MARIEEKSTKAKSIASKVLLWVAVGFLAAVLVASIVILILWLVNKDKEEEETPFVEIYETAELITFDDLEEIKDNDIYSEYVEKYETIYVYIYSSNDHKDDETTTTAEKLHDNVLKNIDAFKETTERSVAFLIINVAHEDNKESSLASQYGAGPQLVVFGDEETKTYTAYKDILAGLREARNTLPAE